MRLGLIYPYWAIKKADYAGHITEAVDAKAIMKVLTAKASMKADYVGQSRRSSMLRP